jgi:hypothetical protein
MDSILRLSLELALALDVATLTEALLPEAG